MGFTPPRFILKAEPQSDETPNAVALSSEANSRDFDPVYQPAEKERKPLSNAPTPEASDEIASTQPELGRRDG